MNIRVLSAFLLLLLCTACTQNEMPSDEIYTRLTSVRLKAGDVIPVPTDETMLTVSGRIGTTNVDGTIEMDRNSIIRTGLITYTTIFEEAEHTFKGALLNNMVDAWQIDDEATTLHVIALDGYAVDIPLSHLDETPLFYAMWMDDVLMDSSDRGPAMLVYPINDYALDPDVYGDYGIWQITAIEVR